METSPCHNSVAGHQIATHFCTCHDSTAVVPCTKFCSDHCIRIEVRANRNSHRIWIAMEKPLVKRAPGHLCWTRKSTVTWDPNSSWSLPTSFSLLPSRQSLPIFIINTKELITARLTDPNLTQSDCPQGKVQSPPLKTSSQSHRVNWCISRHKISMKYCEALWRLLIVCCLFLCQSICTHHVGTSLS